MHRIINLTHKTLIPSEEMQMGGRLYLDALGFVHTLVDQSHSGMMGKKWLGHYIMERKCALK